MCLDEALGAFCGWTKRTFGDANHKIEFLGKGTVVRMHCGVVTASNAGEGTSQGLSTVLFGPYITCKACESESGGEKIDGSTSRTAPRTTAKLVLSFNVLDGL
jgi:hypothetical protein